MHIYTSITYIYTYTYIYIYIYIYIYTYVHNHLIHPHEVGGAECASIVEELAGMRSLPQEVCPLPIIIIISSTVTIIIFGLIIVTIL